MARQRHLADTYTNYKAIFATKLKSCDFKRIFSDCNLYDRGTHMEITHNAFVRWDRPESGGRWKKITEERPLATITPDNVLTMTYADEVDITVCNRLTRLTGWPVRLNKRQYSHHRQHVRVYCFPSWNQSEPYFAGMKWDVSGGAAKLLNQQPDLKIVVDNTKVQQAKKEFDAFRKLCKVLAKIGAFDEFADKYMRERWTIPLDKVKPLDEINTANPEFDDAMALIHHGGVNTVRPDFHYWHAYTKQYVQRDLHEVKKGWLERCVENGLKQLRKQFYKANDGYMELAA
jgi:hypothetical protein